MDEIENQTKYTMTTQPFLNSSIFTTQDGTNLQSVLFIHIVYS